MDVQPTAPDSAARPETSRDAALDLLRAVALGRVLLWHAFAASWLTFFAAMPVMFFIAGTLLAASFERAPYLTLLRRRLPRLLIPLWVYGAVVAAAGWMRDPVSSPGLRSVLDAAGHAVTWLVPLVDPAGADWHGGWLSTHLWYLRAYLWILLLTPLLVALARRPARSLPLLALGVTAVEVAGQLGVPLLGHGSARVLLGDAITYGSFVVLGMVYRRVAHRLPVRRLVMALAGVLVAGAGYVAVVGLPPGGVNDAYGAVALTGLAWLLAAGAAETPIRRLAERPRVRRFTIGVSRRAVTIYLWHPAAIVGAYAILQGTDNLSPTGVVHRWGVTTVIVLVLAVAGTVLAVGAVGWVEDLATRFSHRSAGTGRVGARRAGIRMVHLTVVVSPAAAALALMVPSIVVPAAGDPAAAAPVVSPPRPPSYREALSNDAFAARRALNRDARALTRPDRAADRLAAALQRWLDGQSHFKSLAVGVAVNGHAWTGAVNKPGQEPPLVAEGDIGAFSITKTFTTALILQQVEMGRLALDDPVPPVRGLTLSGDAARITLRHLLSHTSGLVDYIAAPGYDATKPLTPLDAVKLSLAAGLKSEPGAATDYANSNFLLLGLVLEEVTGRTYEDLLTELVTAHGLTHTRLGPDRAGWPGFSSGGVVSTLSDLARWGNALFSPGVVLSPDSVRLITTLDDKNLALSMWPVCPCSTAPDGTKRYSAIGQTVGPGGLFHFPSGMAMIVQTEQGAARVEDAMADLGHALEAALRRP